MPLTIEYKNFPYPPQLPENFEIPKDIPFLQTADQHNLEVYEYLKHYKHIVVIGQGGSVNSIRALQESLPTTTTIHIVDSQDPYKLKSIKEKAQGDGLVLAISKSGNTLSVLQSLSYFQGMPMLAITEDEGALAHIANVADIPMAHHPAIGGRFIGNALPGLLPAYLAGMDTAKVIEGANECYATAQSTDLTKNQALLTALHMYVAETKGMMDVFMPIYDARLAGSKELIMQLCHETYGKGGKGQTVLALEAPESQHHTNQKYFGGPRNMLGMFLSVDQTEVDANIALPETWQNITVKSQDLHKIDGLSYQTALHYELQGVMENADHNKMPYIHINLDHICPKTMGHFMAFWQLVAMYSAVLRDVDPFDQPEVEYAKNATRKLLLD